MKKIISILLVLLMLASLCYTLIACDNDGDETPKSEDATPNSETPKSETPKSETQESKTPDSTTPDSKTPDSGTVNSEPPKQGVKLNAPVLFLGQNGIVSWQLVSNAVSYVYKIDGGSEIGINSTFVQLTSGQSVTVKAVGDGTNYLDSDWSNVITYTQSVTPPVATKLNVPVVYISPNGLASWVTVYGAIGYKYVINGGNEQTAQGTSVQLSVGQSISVKAVGDGVAYLDSDYSAPLVYQGGTTPEPSGNEPKYLGIIASNNEPAKSDGVPGVILPRVLRARGNLSLSEILNSHFQNQDNYLGQEYPSVSSYDAYSRAGETVYVQIWLDNPDQYTILSLMLNGTKYQVGGGLTSFFIEEGGAHYNCVYVAITIPNGTYVEKSYTVTNIEYIANTFINADGTDQFMNENDTVTVGLPYSNSNVGATGLSPMELTTSSFKLNLSITDIGRIVEMSGSWLGIAVYDTDGSLKLNKGLTVGDNTVDVNGLAEDTEYTVEVYIYGDLHDGKGVCMHTVASTYVITESDIDYIEVEPEYYSKWGMPEIGEEPDSGLSVRATLYLKSNTATYDRLELYKGDELVLTDYEFNRYKKYDDLLANTVYTVRIYYSDTNYQEHYVERNVTTGKMEKPEVELREKYGFVNSALFTFDKVENGFLGVAIAKNIRVEILRDDIWQLEYKDWILKLCDDPELYDRTQAAFDEAIEKGDYALASKIDHESLTYLRLAKDAINSGELGDFGTDRSAWEAYFETVSRTFYMDSDELVLASDKAILIFLDYFDMFTEGSRYKIYAEVDMKDGEGFVSTELGSGSIYSLKPINSEENHLSFDCQVDGMNIKVNPYFEVNREEQRILIVSYEIGLYTRSGDLIETLYTSKKVDWSEIDEEAWINAYVCAMKGEAILPSEEQMIKELGWKVTFEILRTIDFGFEDDYTGNGGSSSGDIIIDGNGSTIVGGESGGRGEKNIANERERQILRELLAYDYPEDYEYRIKTTMLEAFMQDESYYELIDSIDDIDGQLEALISGALNSTIQSVIGVCESGIYHFLTWVGSEEDEIYIGFKKIIEDYLEDTGKAVEVDWQDAYRRFMTTKDFYYFYPFGYVEDLEIRIEDGKYPSGEYIIGIKYRYDSYEEGEYRTDYDHYNIVKITGKLPVPTFELDKYGYINSINVETEYFWDYHFEIEIKNAQGTVVFTGTQDEWNSNSEASSLSVGWSVRIRTVFNEGATSELYNGDSDWSEPCTYEGARLDKPELEYVDNLGGVRFYCYDDSVLNYVYTINDGVIRTLPKSYENFIYLNNGDVLRIKSVPTAGAIANGYIESEWAEYTCNDEREAISTPSDVTVNEDYKRLEWTPVEGAEYYVIEISYGNERWTEDRVENYYDLIEMGKTYRVRAVVNYSEDKKSSDFSEPYTYTVKLDAPELLKVNSTSIRLGVVAYAQGYNYKVGENGEVMTSDRPILYFERMGEIKVGDQIYVQAFAEGCESSEWVLIYTVTEDVISQG